jgi:PncC family amidohydrolase
MEAQVGELLRARGMTVALAESCTGGLIMHRLSNIAGSSAYLLGGLVVYSYEAKVQFAGVRQADLIAHGAVSEVVAAQMADGVRAAFHADVALSVTGIAGPGGGTPEKPVGLVYIGLSAADLPSAHVIRRVWDKDREGNKAQSAEAALAMLHTYLSGLR